MNWTLLGTLLAVALVACCMGFKRFVWFMSIGYGLAVAAIALATLVAGPSITGNPLTPGLIAGLVVCLAYGLRLGVFLWRREMGNEAYRKVLATKVGNEPGIVLKVLAWVFISALYVCETTGLHQRLANGTPDNAAIWIGVAIMVVGAVVEAVADHQKSAQKAKRPDMVATEGLFKFVRCPNYLGEIVFWTGVLVCGFTSVSGTVQLSMALIGYVIILFVMLDGAKRMAKGHESRYGDNPEYQAYAEKTPLLFPFGK